MESKRCNSCRKIILLDQFKMLDRHKYSKICLKRRDIVKQSQHINMIVYTASEDLHVETQSV